jgi:hypothetical protein
MTEGETPRDRHQPRAVRRVLVAGHLTLLLALAACGGSSSGASHSSSASSEAQFRVQADAVCARADAKARSLIGSSDRLSSASLDRVVALLERTAAELSRLTPPPALRAGYQHYLTFAKGEIALFATLEHDVDTRNLAGVRSLERRLNGDASNVAAQRIGLAVCAREVG